MKPISGPPFAIVERNPVRAGMVKKAERYPWSSAAAHCHLRVDGLLSQKAAWQRQLTRSEFDAAWLAEGDNPDEISIIRRNIEKGLSCGSDRFIRRLEKLAGRILQYRPHGRPKKEEDQM